MPKPSSIRFYFSFRSPYAWMAAEKLEDVLGDLGLEIEAIPIYPTPENFPADPALQPLKNAYFAQDVYRMCTSMGLAVQHPPALDTDWSLAHAAWLGAEEQGSGRDFMLEMFRSRWSRSLDIGEEDVIADAAKRAGADPEGVLRAGHDAGRRARVDAAWTKAAEQDGVFGVPSFVYGRQLFWGQDRMEQLRDVVRAAA